MTGIDTVTTALLASRLDSLLGGGVSAGVARSAAPASPGAPAPSVQTELSRVALTLDAISRYGGAATPAVTGHLPLLAGPPVLDSSGRLASLDAFMPSASAASAASAAADGTPPGEAGGTGGASRASGATSATGSAAQASAGAASGAASVVPGGAGASVATLAVALARAVSDSGLFYESHLSQWLAGQRSTTELAQEPQMRLTRGAGTPVPAAGSRPAAPPPAVIDAAPDARQAAPGRFGAAGAQAYAWLAADDGAGRRFAAATGQSAGSAASGADSAADTAAAMAAVHPATLPLVRQQLDLLATQAFRWTGEAWPGARLDWRVEPDAGSGADADAPPAWRTRLVLALPSLGTVDAELVLTGSRLGARLRTTEAGAAKLGAHGDALRQRLLAAGLALGRLSIRSVDTAPDSVDAVATRAAADAYGQAAVPYATPLGFDLGDAGDIGDVADFGLHDDGAW